MMSGLESWRKGDQEEVGKRELEIIIKGQKEDEYIINVNDQVGSGCVRM